MIEDGDIGYAGEYHASFVARRQPGVAHIRATPAGDAALERIRDLLSKQRASQSKRAPVRSTEFKR
ncbi:hypothetical protein [Burkholderia ubonensis]|uniref:hypothetical protein n=1 Tax=Burkholderia ubonensis TaxID=101571 RepID=UPI001624B2D9|nr:hypothetical protein [Burkholderia ubonensis]